MIRIEHPTADSTKLIQDVIDSVAAHGGGIVAISGGTYVIGTIWLRSHICLQLEPGARLLGSANIADYDTNAYYNRYLDEKRLDRCLIYAEDAEDVTIRGSGIIDGNKNAFPNANDPIHHRPMMIRLVRCKRVRLESISLLDAAGWTTAFHLCDGVFVSNVYIKNTPHPNGTADGLDFDGSQNITVTNCTLDTGDDCICLQNSYPGVVSRNVTISNCTMTGTWAGFRIGISSVGDIRDVVIQNIVMQDLGCSGLKIQCTEGGTLENMLFSNIVMHNVPRAVFATLNHYPMTITAKKDMPHTGILRNMIFRDITLVNDSPLQRKVLYIEDTLHGVVVVGEPGSDIENLVFDGIDLSLEGGGEDSGLPVEEMTGLRPEYFVYQHGLPAGAMYFRHVKDICVRNAKFRYQKPESRPDIVCQDGEVDWRA